MPDTTHNIRIRMDTSGVRRGAAETQTGLQRIERSADRASTRVGLIGRAFGNLRTSILSTTGALAGFSAGFAAIAGVRVLAGFEDQLATVRSITGSTAQEFNRLSDAAKNLGATTRFTATEAGQALEFLARAGISASQSINLLPTVLKLAQAENLSLAEAADIASKSFRIFRRDVTDVPELADQLSSAASNSATNIRELFQAIRYGGPISAGFKVDAAEVLAVFEVLANNAQSATIAGTQVRGILSRIASATKEFTKDLKSTGVAIEDINPEGKTLIQIFEALGKAGVNTSKAFDLFKQRAGSGAEILITNLDEIKKRTERLRGAIGTLDFKFEIKSDTLLNDLFLALSAVQGLVIALGDAGLTRILRIVFQTFAFVFNSVRAGIAAITPLIQNIGIGLAIAFSPFVLAGFIAGILHLLRLMPLLIATVFRLAGALVLLAAANPFTAIGVAIGVVITAFQKWGTEIGVIGAKYATLADLWQAISNRISSFFGRISDAAQRAFQGVVSFGTQAANALISVFERAINFIIEKLNSVLAFNAKVANSIRSAFGLDPVEAAQLGNLNLQFEPPEIVSNILKEADDLALERIGKEKAARADLIGSLHGQAVAQQALADQTNTLSNATGGAADSAKKLKEEIDLTSELLNEIQGPADAAREKISVLNDLFADGTITASQYNDQLQRLREQLLSTDQTFSGGILRGLNKVAEGATRVGERVEQFVVGAFQKATDAIVNFAKTGKFDFRALISSILEDLLRLATNQLFGQLAQGLLGGFGGGIGGGGGFGGLLGGLGGLFGFARGGAFTVGGTGGTDSQLVAFKATPGERVSVGTPQQQTRADSGNITVNQPPINLKVVNSLDPASLLDALSTGQGERTVTNIIQRNAASIRAVLGVRS